MDTTVPGSVYLVVGFSLVVAFFIGCGYVLNILKMLFGSGRISPFVRFVGIFIPIVGAIFGWL